MFLLLAPLDSLLVQPFGESPVVLEGLRLSFQLAVDKIDAKVDKGKRAICGKHGLTRTKTLTRVSV